MQRHKPGELIADKAFGGNAVVVAANRQVVETVTSPKKKWLARRAHPEIR